MFLRILIFLSMVAMVAGFFFPYFEITVAGNVVFTATGFDIFSQANEHFGVLSLQEQLYLLIVPITGLWCIFAFFKRWHSFAYYFIAILALGGLGYVFYENFAAIKQTTNAISKSSGLLNSMAEIANSPLKLGINTLGLGVYLQAGGLLLTILLGMKDPLNKLRAKPEAPPTRV